MIKTQNASVMSLLYSLQTRGFSPGDDGGGGIRLSGPKINGV